MDQDNEWEIVDTYQVDNRANFWNAILLSVTKPHLINRRLAGSEQISLFRIHANELNNNVKFIEKIASRIQKHFAQDVDAEFMKKHVHETDISIEFDEIGIQHISKCDLNKDKQILIVLSKLLPKSLVSNKCTFEVAVLGDPIYPTELCFGSFKFNMQIMYKYSACFQTV